MVKHSPAKQILLFKADIKGDMATKGQQEEFRNKLRVTIGEELIKEVTAIRPTRFGGYMVIFHTNEARGVALEVLRRNEKQVGILEENSNIIALKRKTAKVVCRDPPVNYSIEKMLKDLYDRRNPLFQQIQCDDGEAKIFITRLGWIFDLSSIEVAAVQGQGERIRYGFGREIKVEEFISLQQCYKYCAFGHNAQECRSEKEQCRLCAKIGHLGKDCKYKEDKTKWKCANYQKQNETKGTHLDTDYGAAQLHTCSVAQAVKKIRKLQLAAAGIFTTLIIENQNVSVVIVKFTTITIAITILASYHPLITITIT